MEIKSFEAKVRRKNNIVYADVVKASKYFTEARGISKYHYNPEKRTFVCIDSGGSYGEWMTRAGAESHKFQIDSLKKKGFIVFYGRPTFEKIKRLRK